MTHKPKAQLHTDEYKFQLTQLLRASQNQNPLNIKQLSQPSMPDVRIGTVPDAHLSRVALVSGNTILELHSLNLPLLMQLITSYVAKNNVEVILEDLEQWKSIKPRQGQSVKAMLKIARNVGKCQGTAKAIHDLLTDAGIEVRQAMRAFWKVLGL